MVVDGHQKASGLAFERHYTPQELALRWNLKIAMVRGLIGGERVLRFGGRMRVPESIVLRLDERLKSLTGWIYFLKPRGLPFVKIGYAKRNWINRVDGLQVAWPVPLDVLAVIPGSQAQEAELHERFKVLYLRGEWFSDAPVLVDFIDKLPDKHQQVKVVRTYKKKAVVGTLPYD